MRLILMGPPGAGKGTQGERLADELGVPRYGTGDRLRDARREGTELGRRAAEYIDKILTRVTLPGSVYLAVIAVLPYWIFEVFDIQTFFFGGTSLLIIVGVALRTVQKMQQHLMLRQYEGFMKKGRVGGAAGGQGYI